MLLLCLSLLFFFSSLLSSAGSMELISSRLSAAFVSNTQAGRAGTGERDGRPYFSFKEGFTLLPPRRLFLLLTPFHFFFSPGREQREYVGTNASGSVWLVWLEDAEETGSLQPT